MNRPGLKIISAFGLAILGFVVLNLLYNYFLEKQLMREVKTAQGERRMQILFDLRHRIKRGMRTEEVVKVIGKADNKDTSNVWMWWDVGTNYNSGTTWTENYSENGFFILVRNGMTISSLVKNTEMSPWECYSEQMNCRVSDAEKILGKRPKLIERQ
ncbi:MAG: hypothetical protein JWM16_2863 [Verrucomicrobiales bacterium]|nr:hypothetical protein [Verrucomicrobiales bacterium]